MIFETKNVKKKIAEYKKKSYQLYVGEEYVQCCIQPTLYANRTGESIYTAHIE